jgi:hypothetical protein
LRRFGYHAQPTEFVLTFSSALDPARAQDPNNYILRPIGADGHLGKRIRIVSAVYNPIAHTVTLHPVKLVYLFRRYQLVVNGMPPAGLAGPSGVLLDGLGSGVPGSNYVRNFGRGILAGRSRPIARPFHREIEHLPSAGPHASRTPPRPGRAASERRTEPTRIPVPNGGLVQLPPNAVDAVLATLVAPFELQGHARR